MGKSPAKWIKAVLLGKKSSKSSLTKNVTTERMVATNASAGGTVPVESDLLHEATDEGGETMEIEKGTSASLPSIGAASLAVRESADSQGSSAVGAEMTKEEQAAIKAQAAFRGYLARRAFRALKGIIRLQALIRGHLVRRQAVATLHCMQAIVKLQALVRGRKVRILYPHLQVLGKDKLAEIQDTKSAELLGATMSQKLATYTFAKRLLASLPTAMPLSLQYDLAEPNAARNWLERWSLLCFWEPLPQPKKIVDKKSKTKPAVEPQTGKSKRTVRKVPTVSNSDNNASNSSEIDKPKRSSRKGVNNHVESAQEHPQNELERVKRSLRKVSASAAMASEKSETETEKAQEGPGPGPGPKNTSAFGFSDQGGVNSSEKSSSEAPAKLSLTEAPVKLSLTEAPAKLSLTEAPAKLSLTEAPAKLFITEDPSEPLTVNESVEVIQEGPTIENHSSENGGKVEELSTKEDQTSKENQKVARRRRSLPAKQEYPENVSQNTRSVPSYMAATESAKAKLRAQLAASLSEDGNDTENGFVRRHSLPSSTNGKLSSVSPRVPKPLQANGKGAIKINKSLSSSKDDKAQVLPGWRR